MSADFSQIRYERLQKAIVQQHKAANPAHSVWVSASAGTGKTRVLSDRVLRMLLKKIDAGKILCLTYTKAAAAEMKTRIFERLSEWSVMSDAKLEKSLTDLLGEEVADKRNMEATTNCPYAIRTAFRHTWWHQNPNHSQFLPRSFKTFSVGSRYFAVF